jgi:hypothetical protein
MGGEPEKFGSAGPAPEILTKFDGPRFRMHLDVHELEVGTLRAEAM